MPTVPNVLKQPAVSTVTDPSPGQQLAQGQGGGGRAVGWSHKDWGLWQDSQATWHKAALPDHHLRTVSALEKLVRDREGSLSVCQGASPRGEAEEGPQVIRPATDEAWV